MLGSSTTSFYSIFLSSRAEHHRDPEDRSKGYRSRHSLALDLSTGSISLDLHNLMIDTCRVSIDDDSVLSRRATQRTLICPPGHGGRIGICGDATGS